MSRTPPRKQPRCELARRLREPHELRSERYAYWRARVRLCRNVAVALVLFAGQRRDLHVCRECFDREARERPGDWLEFEMLERPSSRRRRDVHAHEDPRTRAPVERSDVEPRQRQTMAQWRELVGAGLDPTEPREIGDLLRQQWRELGIPGAAAPEAAVGGRGPDQSEPRSLRLADRNRT